MRVRHAVGFVIARMAALVRPSAAEACSCGPPISSPAAVNYADSVFVGTVHSARGAEALKPKKPGRFDHCRKRLRVRQL